MLNYRFKAILKREIVQQIFSKKFVVMTLSMPIIMLLMIGLQIFFVSFEKEELSNLQIINESVQLQGLIQEQINGSELSNQALYQLDFSVKNADEMAQHLQSQQQALLNGELTGIVYIPDSTRDDKKISYYSSNPNNQILQSRLRELVNKAVINEYFNDLNIDSQAIDYARTSVSVDGIRVSREGTAGFNPSSMILAIVFTFLLYISLLGAGPTVMAAVNEEKTNRVVEVLLSSVSSEELVFGKILGTAVTGLLQMIIWISPALVMSLISLPSLIMFNDFSLEFNFFDILYFLINFLMAVLAFLSIFAAFGAMFDNPQDAQGSMMPVMMLIIIPFFMTFSMARNPANVLAEVCSLLPFTNFMVMPARMTLIDVPYWQFAVAILVNLATIYFCMRLSAKVYRTTILMTGKRPSWKEIYKWLRYA